MINALIYTVMESPLGDIVITSNGESLTGLYTSEHKSYEKAQTGQIDSRFFYKAIQQLKEYFEGIRFEFDLRLAPEGSFFQKQVWNILKTIRYGETKSYTDIANKLQNQKYARAAGSAISKNPISIIIPCHRVVNIQGHLTGYAGGLATKVWLLNHEVIQQPL